MDKDTKFALLAIGLPFVGLVYCGLMIMVIYLSPTAQQHPIITAAIFALAPSVLSGSIWLKSSFKSRTKERLGL